MPLDPHEKFAELLANKSNEIITGILEKWIATDEKKWELTKIAMGGPGSLALMKPDDSMQLVNDMMLVFVHACSVHMQVKREQAQAETKKEIRRN
jgi:hypothetical protein